MRSLILPGALVCLLLTGSSGRGGELPKEVKPAVEKGLAWLAKQQHKDGHWAAAGGQHRVAMTGLAGMAFLAEGSTAARGKYKDNVRRAIDWLTTVSQPKSGLIGDPSNPADGRLYMFGHGYAMLFLACAYEGEEDKDRKRRLAGVLNRAVRFSAASQTNRGGWGYITARDGANFDEGAATAAQVQALRAARNAGIPVPKALLVSTRAYLRKSTGADGGVIYSLSSGSGGGGRPPLTAAALAGAYPPSEYNQTLVKRWFTYCQKYIAPGRIGRAGHDEYTMYYYAQAVHGLGEDGYAKLFPQAKESERLVWSKFRKPLFDEFVKTQAADGSWGGSYVGPVYRTALFLTVLQLDREALPLYRR